jgi:hypothetical protein
VGGVNDWGLGISDWGFSRLVDVSIFRTISIIISSQNNVSSASSSTIASLEMNSALDLALHAAL